MQGRLVVRRPGHPPEVHVLEQERTLLGRAADCSVLLPDPFVSRHHAEIVWNGEAYVLRDLASRNGTRVNGERVAAPVVLKHGDQIALGTTTVLFQMTDVTLVVGSEPTGSLRVNLEAAEAWVGDTLLELTAKEFRALALLYQRAGLLCTKDELARHVWPEYEGNVGDANIEQLISRLRRKLEQAPGGAERLVTVRGLGYRLRIG